MNINEVSHTIQQTDIHNDTVDDKLNQKSIDGDGGDYKDNNRIVINSTQLYNATSPTLNVDETLIFNNEQLGNHASDTKKRKSFLTNGLVPIKNIQSRIHNSKLGSYQNSKQSSMHGSSVQGLDLDIPTKIEQEIDFKKISQQQNIKRHKSSTGYRKPPTIGMLTGDSYNNIFHHNFFNVNGRNHNDVQNNIKSQQLFNDTGKQTPYLPTTDQSIILQQSKSKLVTQPGQKIIDDNVVYLDNIHEHDFPETPLNKIDYLKRLRFEELKKYKYKAMTEWKMKDVKGTKKNIYIKEIQNKNDQILKVAQKNSLERNEVYIDRFPCLIFRKKIWEFVICIHMAANAIISTKAFDSGTFFVIMMNTLVMMIDDSATNENPSEFFEIAENYFLYLYTVEMVMKIVGLGFIFGPDSYLKDQWNLLDFFIVISSWFSSLSTGSKLNVSSMRTFRVLRPLKTISSVKGLKVLMTAVFSAIPLLKDTMIILGFFFVAFGIGGLQLMSGSLKWRCIQIETGLLHEDDIICGDLECPGGYFCGKHSSNPNYGVTNFDNLLYSILCVFQCVTLEGWSDIQSQVQRAVSQYMFMFFIPIVFGGAFLLLNLLLAVINSKFTEAHNIQQKADQKIKEAKMRKFNNEDQDLKNALAKKDQMSVSQYINAKIYARKMVEFLRLRQEIKKIENERILRMQLRGKKLKRNKMMKQTLQPVEKLDRYVSKMKKMKQDQIQKTIKINQINQSWRRENEVGDSDIEENSKQIDSNKIIIANGKDWGEIALDVQYRLSTESFEANQEQESNDYMICEQSNNFIDNRFIHPLNPMSNESSNTKIIIEDQHGENADDESLEQNFLKEQITESKIIGKSDILRRNRNEGNMQSANLPKRINMDGQICSINQATVHTGRLTMKGNIGQMKKNNFLGPDESHSIFKLNMAEELDIDNIIPKNEQKQFPSEKSYLEDSNNGNIFHLSIENIEQQSNSTQRSQRQKINFALENIPGLDSHRQDRESQSSGLVTSDSNIDIEAQDIDINNNIAKGSITHHFKHTLCTVNKIQNKTVSENHLLKAQLKEILQIQSQQYNLRDNLTNNEMLSGTFYSSYNCNQTNGGLKKSRLKTSVEDGQTIISSSIEDKFKSQMKQLAPDAHYKTISNEVDDKKLIKSLSKDKYKSKADKKKIIQIEEIISTTQPKDPFKNINPLNQKVDIAKNINYKCSSQNDVLQQRMLRETHLQPIKENNFILIPCSSQNEHVNHGHGVLETNIKVRFEPYQQKINYRAQEDSSSISSDQSDKDNDLHLLEQPYETITSIAYERLTRTADIKHKIRRSDIMSLSTLSFSLFPTDKREMQKIEFSEFDNNQIKKYVDEKCAFLSLVKNLNYNTRQVPEKHKELKDTYIKSFLMRSEYATDTLTSFKNQVKILHTNVKVSHKKSAEIRMMEKNKHEQNKRASKKRGLPKFNMEECIKLLDGKFHEEQDNENDINIYDVNEFKPDQHIKRTKTKMEKDYQMQMEKFEMNAKLILDEDIEEIKKKKFDEIPYEIRKTFNIPETLGQYQINFRQVRKHDASKKKQKPMWSGQDVFKDQLNYEKSMQVVTQINYIRVWPLGFLGQQKRCRFVLRQLVKSDAFDNLMTFAVVLNTVVLSMNKYGQTDEMTILLEILNTYFTWIFIVEMSFKILAIGISKYVSDKMNCLDGFVVMLSVVEMVAESLAAGKSNSLSAFKTVRMLRTFRVFRIGRILRTLQSMKTIIGVVVRSYKSFGYITILMFLFIFIFSLLGMSIFGGFFNFEDGRPRGNYDSFPLAFITVFQVLTLENWQTLLFDSMRSSISPYIISAFYIVWIFLGNFILLNLFLAILLDSFLEEDDGNEDEEHVIKKKIAKRHRQQEKKRKKMKNKLMMAPHDCGHDHTHTDLLAKFNLGEGQGSNEDIEDLDEEQIIQIFQQEGIIQKDRKELSQIHLYAGVECQASFYLFSKENSMRTFCYKSYMHPQWEKYVITIVMLSSVKLAIDSYIVKLNEDSILIKLSQWVDLTFNFIFITEMSIKTIALGLVMDEGSYLRDSWNQLDFFIVISSVMDMLLTNSDLEAMKILRILRTLRPLRIISNNVAMKLIVNALIMSINHIVNVGVVIFFVYLIFAIMGVNFFNGKFQYCSIDKYQLHDQIECEREGGLWKTYQQNFDDINTGMLTLYVIASLEGWPEIMHQTLDITGYEQGPVKENKLHNMLFFVGFILIGSFFFLNFFIGVLFMKFNQCQKNEQKGYSQQDLGWQDIQRLILQAKPEYESTNVPKQLWRRKFHMVVSSTNFDLLIMGFIILNMVQMALEYDDMEESYAYFLESSNLCFSIVFALEAVLKIIAYGNSYFKNSWNKFDFFVVLASIFDQLLGVLDLSSMENQALIEKGPQVVKVARMLRVTRIVRLAGKAKNLQAIIQTIQFSIPALLNVLFLLLLFYFMFSILGNFFFSGIIKSNIIDENKNFHDFLSSFLMLIALTTGEDWNLVMFDCALKPSDGCIKDFNCGNMASIPYFISLIMICSYVMLNLFILVIIQQFEKYYLPDVNMLSLFKTDLISFMTAWKIFTQERYDCIKMKENQLTKFFRKLGEEGDKNSSLGFAEEYYADGELKKNLLKMGIKSDGGYIYFNELLYRCMRRKYGNMKINKKMQIFELRTQYRIYTITREMQNKGTLNKDELYDGLINKNNGVNPFLTVMNFKISYRSWLKLAQNQLQKEMLLNQNQSLSQATKRSLEQMKEVKTYSVDIEMEQYEQYTSEEEDFQDDTCEINKYCRDHKITEPMPYVSMHSFNASRRNNSIGSQKSGHGHGHGHGISHQQQNQKDHNHAHTNPHPSRKSSMRSIRSSIQKSGSAGSVKSSLGNKTPVSSVLNLEPPEEHFLFKLQRKVTKKWDKNKKSKFQKTFTMRKENTRNNNMMIKSGNRNLSKSASDGLRSHNLSD